MEPKPRWRLSLLRLRRDKKLRGAGPAGPAAPRVSARAAMREALGPTETFEPPPLPCGHCMLSLRMSDSNDGLEELNAELRFTNGEKAAKLRGMYIFREENGDFLDCCARGPERLKHLAPVLFNEFGRPKEVLKKQCGVRARTGGFLWLVSLDVSEELGLDIQKEFIQKVFCVLAGAMKRLTLVLCLHDSIDRVQHMDLHPMDIDGQQVFSWEKRSSDPKAMAQVASRERRLRPPEEPMEAMEAVLPPQEDGQPSPERPPTTQPEAAAEAPETAPEAPPSAALSNSTATPSAPSNEMTQSSVLMSPAPANVPGTPNSMAGSLEESSDVEGNPSVPLSPGRDFRTRWRMKGKGSANRNEPPAAQSTSPAPAAAAAASETAEPTKAVPAPAPAPAPAAVAPAAQAAAVPKKAAGKAVEVKGKGKVKGKLKAPWLAPAPKRRLGDMAPPPLHAAMRRQQRPVSLESGLEEPPLPAAALERTPSASSSLSPRMQWALLRSAACAQRMWAKQVQKLENGRAGVDIWLGEELPEKFQAGVHKAFLRGMMEVASAVEQLLGRGREPAVATLHCAFPATMDAHDAAMQQRMLGLRVLQGRQRHSLSHFYGKGGRLADVLRLLLVDAERFCQKQDASVQDVGEEPSSAWAERFAALPPRDSAETWAALVAALGLDEGDAKGDAKRRRVG